MRVVAAFGQGGQPPQSHSFGAENLSVGAAAHQPLRKLHASTDVQQGLFQLSSLQVELVPDVQDMF